MANYALLAGAAIGSYGSALPTRKRPRNSPELEQVHNARTKPSKGYKRVKKEAETGLDVGQPMQQAQMDTTTAVVAQTPALANTSLASH